VPRIFEIVNPGGVLAIQVPADNDSPVRQALLKASSSSKWSRFTSGTETLITYNSAEYYYNLLFPISKEFDIWETIYYHVLDSQAGPVEWYKGTAMKPFLERIPDEASRKEFEDEVTALCAMAYPLQRDGKVLYPFKRIFFIAYK